MENKYDIDSLIKTFGTHAENNEKHRKFLLESNSSCEWAKDDFSISKALSEMCKEIKELKNGK